MTYQVNRTQQLAEAHARSRFGQKASLQAAGVPTAQHNAGEKPKKAAKKSSSGATSKKTAAKKTAKKS